MTPLVEGPSYGPLVRTGISRTFVWCSPLYVTAGSFAFFAAADTIPGVRQTVAFPAIGLALLLAIMCVVVSLLVPDDLARNRRKRHVALRERAGADHALEGLAWSGHLLGDGQRYKGSLHAIGHKLYFLWHVTILRPEVAKETVLDLDLAQIAAVEVGPPHGFIEWLVAGPGQVQLLLKDGRTMRVGTSDAERLASALREITRRPEGAPVGVATESLDERARALAAGARAAAVIVLRDEKPYVLLEGDAAALRGALEQALDVLRSEKRGLDPFVAAREKAP